MILLPFFFFFEVAVSFGTFERRCHPARYSHDVFTAAMRNDQPWPMNGRKTHGGWDQGLPPLEPSTLTTSQSLCKRTETQATEAALFIMGDMWLAARH